VTHAYDCHVHVLLAIEDVGNEVDEHLHIIALLRIAGEANKHKIATHLHSCDAMDARKDVREYVCDTLSMTL
jgi:hypothetical protein